MLRKLFLHAGKHKTGTTSIQLYLHRNEDFFARQGMTAVKHRLVAPDGRKFAFPVTNCVDIAHSIIRPDLLTPIRMRRVIEAPQGQEERQQNAELINGQLHAMSGDALIVSAEAFSFLRTDDERKFFDTVFDGFDVCSIAFFRETRDWMESWKLQTQVALKRFGTLPTVGDSVFDYGFDSWLVDDDAIKRFFQPNGRFLSYEKTLQRYGNVIPAFLLALGLSPDTCPPWCDTWENKTLKSATG